MHRTVNVRRHGYEVCGSQRKKPKSLRYRRTECLVDSKRAEQGTQPYSALKLFLWVFSATILRPLTSARNYATLSLPKKQIRRNFFSIFRFNTLILCIVLIPYLIYNNTSHAFKRNYICTRYRQNFYNIVLYILNRICFFRCKSAFLCNSFMFE